MPRVHEIPTHLNVQDTLIGSLTPPQLVRLMVCASLAYGVWDQFTFLPPLARAALAGILVLTGVLTACWQPQGCSLDQWALALFVFRLTPRRLVWRRPAPRAADWRPAGTPDWADLSVEVAWTEDDSRVSEKWIRL
jgi:hypothetical protein